MDDADQHFGFDRLSSVRARAHTKFHLFWRFKFCRPHHWWPPPTTHTTLLTILTIAGEARAWFISIDSFGRIPKYVGKNSFCKTSIRNMWRALVPFSAEGQEEEDDLSIRYPERTLLNAHLLIMGDQRHIGGLPDSYPFAKFRKRPYIEQLASGLCSRRESRAPQHAALRAGIAV